MKDGKLKEHVETFNEARDYVIERLAAGEKVSPGVLMHFPAIAKELQSTVVTGDNREKVAATLPGQVAERLEVGCKVWPVYLDGTTGVAVEWPDARLGAVAYVATSKRGRRWMKPVFGSFVGENTPVLVSDEKTKQFRLGFDEFGRILPGGMVEREDTLCSVWRTDHLTFQYVAATGKAAVWARGKEVVSGNWDAAKHQVVIGEGKDALRVSAYGEIVDEHGNVYVKGRKARNILVAQATETAIGKGFIAVVTAGLTALKTAFTPLPVRTQSAPDASELAYTVGADNVVSFSSAEKAING